MPGGQEGVVVGSANNAADVHGEQLRVVGRMVLHLHHL